MKYVLAKYVLALMTLPGIACADPAFVNRSSGLPGAQVYDGGWEHFVGGGVAILDCNADHKPDLYAAGGVNPARLFVNSTATPGGDIGFAEGSVPNLTGVTGAWPIDIDSDGWLDLVVLRRGPNVLLKGGPECAFQDATAEWGFDGADRWSTAFTATWEAGQDWPTLAVGNYVDLTRKDGPFEACDVNELHRPQGKGFGKPVEIKPGFCALSMLISDWKRNGIADLRISNDRQYYVRGGYEQMWHMSPLAEYTEAEGWKKVSLWGMGIASRDINGDGLPEVMLTSMADQLLQMNRGNGVLEAVPFSFGTYAHRPYSGDDGRPSTGWHAEFGDVNNDGRSDLFIAKGNVQEMPSNAMEDPNNLLIQQENGTFLEKGDVAGVGTTERSRGAGLADLNGDGKLDIVVMNRQAPMEIWQNATVDSGNWLQVEPLQSGSNSRAVGAWVEVRVGNALQTQEITVGGGHGSGQAGPLHFGLGAAEGAEVRVIWPGGKASDWLMLSANQRVVLHADAAGLKAE